MGRRSRQIAARHGLARMKRGCALVAALAVGGCASSNVSFSTGSVPTASAPGNSPLGALLLLGFTAGIGYESYKDGVYYRANPFDAFDTGRSLPLPPLDPSRRVLEQDCTQPIADWSANLRCR